MLRVLVFSTLYPNAAQPNHGVFVENRLLQTLALGGLQATVIAPVPYFPSASPVFGRYAAYARVPRFEIRNGLEVWHPRYLVVPKVGQNLAPEALYRAALAQARRLLRAGRRFDVLDAHYFYPDGVAAARLARTLRLPCVITARGSDVTLFPQTEWPRARIRWAAEEANASLAVCEDLRRRLIDLGAPPERTLSLRNGVDLELFAPADRAAARAAFDLGRFTLLSVGALIPRKAHELIIEALARTPDCDLVIAGEGPERAALEALAGRLGVSDRVRFLGEVPHRELPRLYTAADVLVLASSREGLANVLLEAMACGAPVIASNVNGSPEVVSAPSAGRLLSERSAECLAGTLAELRRHMPRREETRRHAEQFGWRAVAQANKAVLDAAARAGYEGRKATRLPDPGASRPRALAEP